MVFESITTADAMENFSINYLSRYTGACLIEIKDPKSVIVLLSKENLEMNWDNFEDYKSLTYKSSPENTAFVNGIAVTQKVEQLVSALNFIKPIYEQEQPSSPKKIKWVTEEIANKKNANI